MDIQRRIYMSICIYLQNLPGSISPRYFCWLNLRRPLRKPGHSSISAAWLAASSGAWQLGRRHWSSSFQALWHSRHSPVSQVIVGLALIQILCFTSLPLPGTCHATLDHSCTAGRASWLAVWSSFLHFSISPVTGWPQSTVLFYCCFIKSWHSLSTVWT